MSFTKWTTTSVFLAPSLGIKKEFLDGNNCINAYSYDKNKEVQYENAVYFLFKPPDLDKFKDFLDSERERTKTLIDDYDYNGGYIILVYQLDKKWEKDIKKIKAGQYSKTSAEYQDLFPKLKTLLIKGKEQEITTIQWRVFEKSDDMREFWEEDLGVRFTNDMEVWPIWNEDKETLDINKHYESKS